MFMCECVGDVGGASARVYICRSVKADVCVWRSEHACECRRSRVYMCDCARECVSICARIWECMHVCVSMVSVWAECMCKCVQMCVSPRGAGRDGAGGACSSRLRSVGFLLG